MRDGRPVPRPAGALVVGLLVGLVALAVADLLALAVLGTLRVPVLVVGAAVGAALGFQVAFAPLVLRATAVGVVAGGALLAAVAPTPSSASWSAGVATCGAALLAARAGAALRRLDATRRDAAIERETRAEADRGVLALWLVGMVVTLLAVGVAARIRRPEQPFQAWSVASAALPLYAGIGMAVLAAAWRRVVGDRAQAPTPEWLRHVVAPALVALALLLTASVWDAPRDALREVPALLTGTDDAGSSAASPRAGGGGEIEFEREEEETQALPAWLRALRYALAAGAVGLWLSFRAGRGPRRESLRLHGRTPLRALLDLLRPLLSVLFPPRRQPEPGGARSPGVEVERLTRLSPRGLRRRLRPRPREPRAAVLHDWRRMQDDAGRAGVGRAPGQTPTAHVSLLRDDPRMPPDAAALTEAFLLARYSPRDVPPEIAEQTRDQQRRVSAALRRRTSRFSRRR